MVDIGVGGGGGPKTFSCRCCSRIGADKKSNFVQKVCIFNFIKCKLFISFFALLLLLLYSLLFLSSSSSAPANFSWLNGWAQDGECAQKKLLYVGR